MTEMSSALGELVAPLAEASFLDLVGRREFAYFPASGEPHDWSNVDWRAIRQLVEDGTYTIKRPDDVRVTRASHAVHADHWTTEGRIDVAKLETFLDQGYSVVLLHLDEVVPALGAICDAIRTRTGEGSFIGAVVTSRSAQRAFKLHFDPEDLLIVQVEGTKRWQVYAEPVVDPVRGMRKPPAPETEPVFDEVLTPGDMLFVPGGHWHHCECGLRTSVHLGVFFLPPTGWHAVKELIQPLVDQEIFRKPLTRVGDPAALAAVEAELKHRIIEQVQAMTLDGFMNKWLKAPY